MSRPLGPSTYPAVLRGSSTSHVSPSWLWDILLNNRHAGRTDYRRPIHRCALIRSDCRAPTYPSFAID